MLYCKSCILPDTRPNLKIMEDGRCNACHLFSDKINQIDWDYRKISFFKLVENIKQKSASWDCVIPVSGGKDSTWQVIKALEYGLKPLCVTWKTPARSALGSKNLQNLIALGVDHIDFSINPDVEKRLTLETFKQKGSIAIPMHMALFAIPLQVAIKFKIPLVLWGENSASEYGAAEQAHLGHAMSRSWLLSYGVTQGTTAEDWVSDSISLKDLSVYSWPSDKELKEAGVTAAFLGWYLPWDPIETYKVAKASGFQALSDEEKAKTGYYKFADVDDEFIISIHHWLKWYKFGFTRTWDNLSLEIRNGRMTREGAIFILKGLRDEYPKEEINRFCHWAGISEQSFLEEAEKFRNHKIWKFKNNQWLIDNFLIEGQCW